MAAYQNKGSWYKETPIDEKTFLICRDLVVDKNPWLEEDAVEKYYTWQYIPYYSSTDRWFILVYDHDVIAEKLQESASANADTSEN